MTFFFTHFPNMIWFTHTSTIITNLIVFFIGIIIIINNIWMWMYFTFTNIITFTFTFFCSWLNVIPIITIQHIVVWYLIRNSSHFNMILSQISSAQRVFHSHEHLKHMIYHPHTSHHQTIHSFVDLSLLFELGEEQHSHSKHNHLLCFGGRETSSTGKPLLNLSTRYISSMHLAIWFPGIGLPLWCHKSAWTACCGLRASIIWTQGIPVS